MSNQIRDEEKITPTGNRRYDEGHELDLIYSSMLSKETTEIPTSYFQSSRYMGVLASFSITTVGAYFAFGGPASVITFIAADIGQ